jgi:hypothetical protein
LNFNIYGAFFTKKISHKPIGRVLMLSAMLFGVGQST